MAAWLKSCPLEVPEVLATCMKLSATEMPQAAIVAVTFAFLSCSPTVESPLCVPQLASRYGRCSPAPREESWGPWPWRAAADASESYPSIWAVLRPTLHWSTAKYTEAIKPRLQACP